LSYIGSIKTYVNITFSLTPAIHHHFLAVKWPGVVTTRPGHSDTCCGGSPCPSILVPRPHPSNLNALPALRCSGTRAADGQKNRHEGAENSAIAGREAGRMLRRRANDLSWHARAYAAGARHVELSGREATFGAKSHAPAVRRVGGSDSRSSQSITKLAHFRRERGTDCRLVAGQAMSAADQPDARVLPVWNIHPVGDLTG
jgi:hypothetical protein